MSGSKRYMLDENVFIEAKNKDYGSNSRRSEIPRDFACLR